MTVAPSLAKASAVARPMPVSAPVMRTTGVDMAKLLEFGARAPVPCRGGMAERRCSFRVGGYVGLSGAFEKDFVRSLPYLRGMEWSFVTCAISWLSPRK